MNRKYKNSFNKDNIDRMFSEPNDTGSIRMLSIHPQMGIKMILECDSELEEIFCDDSEIIFSLDTKNVYLSCPASELLHIGKRVYLMGTGVAYRLKVKAEQRFLEYAARGVIEEGAFHDGEWLVSDEVKRRRIRFTPSKGGIREWTGCTENCYCDYVRAYAAMLLGCMNVGTIAEISKSLLRLGGCSFEEACMWDVYTLHALQFLGMIPGSPGCIGLVMEKIEENRTLDGWRHNPRKLAGFRYYLRFGRYVNDFWNTAGSADREYFFPVYLWWNLTSILPLRATEFLLLPKDCIRNDDGKWILTIRRTRLKKGLRKVGYTIDSDYERCDYEVPGWMAEEILLYKESCTENEAHTLDTLFVPARQTPLGYMTYDQMRRRLMEFREAATGRADYPVNLGDTRHLAMISLILSGGSPVVCRELAGHESFDISSNYYANLSTVVESIVYEKHRERRGEISLEGTLKLRIPGNGKMTAVDGGFCDYPGIEDGDISECMKSFCRDGRFGDCRYCLHFYPEKDGLWVTMREDFRNKVDEDGVFLMEMIEQVRRGNGAQEDIMSALLRLQNSSAVYSKVLERDLGGKRNGETKENR